MKQTIYDLTPEQTKVFNKLKKALYREKPMAKLQTLMTDE